MANNNTYHKLERSLLHNTKKLIRYQHHVSFIMTYIKLNHIPKGFMLKFHNNINDFNYNSILKKCSIKLMSATLAVYKKDLREMKSKVDSTIKKINNTFPEKSDSSNY